MIWYLRGAQCLCSVWGFLLAAARRAALLRAGSFLVPARRA
ncbi:hypothetical protein A2U01_0117623, partial [Trifolium medium]|nr:hypothetical protein [Trifolium medium]